MLKRAASGFMAVLLGAVSLLHSFGDITAWAAGEKDPSRQRIVCRHEEGGGVRVFALRRGAGDGFALDIVVRSYTDEALTDGRLTWSGGEFLTDGGFEGGTLPETENGAEPASVPASPADADGLFAGLGTSGRQTPERNRLDGILLEARGSYEAVFSGEIADGIHEKGTLQITYSGTAPDGREVSCSPVYEYDEDTALRGIEVVPGTLKAGGTGTVLAAFDFGSADVGTGRTDILPTATGPEPYGYGEPDPGEDAAERVRYELTVYGTEFRNVEARAKETTGSEVLSEITFALQEDTAPGTYYAVLSASADIGGEVRKASEAFRITVEGELTLTAETAAGVVTVTGPADAFPVCGSLELQAADVETSEIDGLKEAIDRKSAEEKVVLSRINAVSLRLLADGTEAQLRGSVRIEFTGFAGTDGDAGVLPAAEEAAGVSAASAEERTVTYTYSGGELKDAGAVLDENGTAAIAAADTLPGITLLGVAKNAADYGAYVSSLRVRSVKDGTAPFNADPNGTIRAEEEKGGGSHVPGKDSGESNHIVRTFDSVSYQLEAVVNVTDQQAGSIGGCVYFEAVLEGEAADPARVRFDTEMMLSTMDHEITYIAEDQDGQEYDATEQMKDLNMSAYGSDRGTSSYGSMPRIIKQIFRGYRKLNEGDAGTISAAVGVKVCAAWDGLTLQPTFRAWYAQDSDRQNLDNIDDNALPHPENVVRDTTEMTVSAKPMYDIEVTSDDATNATDTYLLDGGTTCYGKMKNVEISLMLRNEEAGMKLKGIELPQGDLEFDLTFYESCLSSGSTQPAGTYTPALWDYTENSIVYDASGSIPARYTGKVPEAGSAVPHYGHLGRELIWKNDVKTQFSTAAPGDLAGGTLGGVGREQAVYNGGTWRLVKTGERTGQKRPVSTKNDTDPTVTDTQERIFDESSYHVTVSGYDFDLESFLFPDRFLSRGAANIPDTQGYFSSVHIQVVMPIKEKLDDISGFWLVAAASNLSAASLSGTQVTGRQEVLPLPQTEFSADWWEDGCNNCYSTEYTGYVPGTFSKNNSFTAKDSGQFDHKLLSTDGNLWSDNKQDAAAFPGDELLAWGGVHFQGNDDIITSVNLLQKFDTDAFEVLDGEVKGDGITYGLNQNGASGETMTVYYGVDPKQPEGYNTRDDANVIRINAAKEENLVYFRSIADIGRYNEAMRAAKGNAWKDYVCTAVLIEARNLQYRAGRYVDFGIPVRIREDAKEDLTYAMVNSARAWVKSDPDGTPYPQPGSFGGDAWKPESGAAELNERVKIDLKPANHAKKYRNGMVENYYTTNAAALEGVLPQPQYEDHSYRTKNSETKEEKWWFTKRKAGSASIGGTQYGQTMLVLSCQPKVRLANDPLHVKGDPPQATDVYDYDSGETEAWFLMNAEASITRNHSTGKEQFDPDRTTNLEVTRKSWEWIRRSSISRDTARLI